MKAGSKISYVILFVLLFAAFIMLPLGMVIYEHTIVEWWIPVTAAAIIAIGTTPMLFRKWATLTNMRYAIINILCNLFVAGSFSYTLFLGVNYWWANDTSATQVETTVVKKFKRAHTKYRRVSRRTRVADGHWYSYHLELELPDGRHKAVEVPFSTYKKTRTNNTRSITVERGLLGMDIIKN